MNIYDIANKSGVSIATVSRVLNGSDKVSADTRARVMAVMKECNYTPNAFARGLGLNTMRMVGLLCTDVSDLYYAKAVSLLESELRKRSFDTLLCCTGNSSADKQKNLKLLLNKRVDAVVLIGSAFAQDTEYIKEGAKKVPMFIINGFVDVENVYCLLCDEYKAMFDNVGILASKGKKNLLYLYDSDSFSGKCKKAGFEDAATHFGIKGRVVKTEKSIDSAYKAAKKYAFDAALTSEDLLAVGVLKATDGKAEVIGFNNSELALCSSPTLTSVDNMLCEICPMTVDSLEKILSGQTVQNKVIVNAKLVQRESFIV